MAHYVKPGSTVANNVTTAPPVALSQNAAGFASHVLRPAFSSMPPPWRRTQKTAVSLASRVHSGRRSRDAQSLRTSPRVRLSIQSRKLGRPTETPQPQASLLAPFETRRRDNPSDLPARCVSPVNTQPCLDC